MSNFDYFITNKSRIKCYLSSENTGPIKLEPSLMLDVHRGYSLKFISDNPATPTDMANVTMNRT